MKQNAVMDNLDDIRRQWQNLNSAGVPGGTPGITYRSNSRRSKMLRFYRTLTIVAFLWIILGPWALFNAGMPVWLCAVTSLFFAVMGVLCYATYRRIRRMDFARMTVVELLNSVAQITRSHLVHRYVGILLMIPLVSCMFYYFSVNKAMLVGGICGFIFGGTIGLINDARMRRYLKEIRSELMSAYE